MNIPVVVVKEFKVNTMFDVVLVVWIVFVMKAVELVGFAVDRIEEGGWEGFIVGIIDGNVVGIIVGLLVGWEVGIAVGIILGIFVGKIDGFIVDVDAKSEGGVDTIS